MVSGKLFHTQVLLVNVYGPNWDDKNFVIKLIAALPSFNSDYLILGGDLNCVMDPNLDRSNPKPQVPSKMANEISAFLNQTGCVDPWHFYNPHNKVFFLFFTRTPLLFENWLLLHRQKSPSFSKGSGILSYCRIWSCSLTARSLLSI